MIHLAVFGIDTGLAVLLTYLVHSTAWIAAALLLTRLHRSLSPAARHAVWRATLVGPLASCALAPAWCRCWEWSLVAPSSTGVAALVDLPGGPGQPLASALLSAGASRAAEAAAPVAPWLTPLVACWAVVALAGLLLLARAAVRQRLAFASRSRITDAECLKVLEHLAQRAGIRRPIRLSLCTAVSTPFVLSAREICLPPRALQLDRDALQAVLAHELAHIERRDGSWLKAALVLQALAWFQPLHRKLRAELRETAELAADDRAVELTGNALGLARTLTEVASWLGGARMVPSVAMARAGSIIFVRVARLCEPSRVPTPGRFWWRKPWLTLALLAAVGACSPSIGAPYAQTSRAGVAPAGPRNPNATPGKPELLPPGMAHDALTGLPRALELSNEMIRLVRKEQRLQGQIEQTGSCAAEPGAFEQARAEVALLKQELTATARQRQQLERDLDAHTQAWSQELQQRFQHDRTAQMRAWGELPSALLVCLDPQLPPAAPLTSGTIQARR